MQQTHCAGCRIDGLRVILNFPDPHVGLVHSMTSSKKRTSNGALLELFQRCTGMPTFDATRAAQ